MSGVVKVVAGVALVATGIGALAGAGIIGGAGILGGALASASGGLVAGASVLGLSAATWSTIGLVAGLTAAIGSSVLSRSPPSVKSSPASIDRLNASILPLTGRKSVVGRTAMATDIRDQEFTDSQAYLHRFIVNAAHKIQSHDEIWFDDKLAWTSGGGVQGEFVGYLTVATRTEGSAANAINISARMGTTRRFTGCAYVHLKFKLTGNSSGVDSPFAQSVPTRITIVGKGAFFYDPRLDSTVTGGSGSHRASNQATWAWSDTACHNPALALLFYLLGWRINGELSVGLGIPPARIDLESFITAANLCDEDVSLAAGGTEKRYRCDTIWSENDDPTVVIDQLKAAMNADLDDVGGKLRLTVFHNDLASPIAAFGPDNIIGQVQWDQTAPLHETSNIVRGTYTDPSSNSLYQQVDFPQVALASIDGIDRIDQFNLASVQSASQAQRLAKQRLQRMQYGGELRTILDVTGWRVLKNDPVTLSLPVFGWTDKPFRVAEIEQGMDGAVPVVLREEHVDIYAWDADESPAVVAAAPTLYDRALDPIIAMIEIGIPAALANSARAGTAFPDASDSTQGQLFIRTDLDNRLYIRTAGDGLLEVTAGDVLVAAPGGGTEAIYLPPWVEVSDQRVLEALATGESAYELANAAIDALADLADDGLLTVREKRETLIPRAAELERRYAELVTAATTLSVSTSAAGSARTAWLAMLAAISPAWNNPDVDSPVDRTTYDAARDTYDAALEALDRAIKEKAATLSTWAGTTGSDKPEDNATRNNPRGNYAAGTTYYPGDIVVWAIADGGDGNSYQRIGSGSTTGVDPSYGSWTLFAVRGAAGATGDPGAPGLTSAVLPGNSVSVPCYYGGAPKGAIPAITMSVYSGSATNVAGSCSFAVTSSGFTSVSNDGGGVFTPSGMTAATAWVQIVATYGSVSATQKVTFNKNEDAPAFSQQIDTSIAAPASTSYSGEQGGPFTLPVGPDGTITLSANLTYSPATGTCQLAGKFRYRTTPGSGSWIDVDTETTGFLAVAGDDPGTLTFTKTLSGPTSAANWEFDLQLRRSAGTAYPPSVGGKFSGKWQ